MTAGNVTIIAELSHAQSRAPWVREFCNLCIQEILVLSKSSVRSTSKGDQFRWKKNKKIHLIMLIAAVRKSGNASCQQGENERQREKSEQEHIQHFLHKTCNREVLEVSRCSRSKQRQKNVQKSVQSCFLLIRKKVCCTCKVFFWLFSLPSPLWRHMILYFV